MVPPTLTFDPIFGKQVKLLSEDDRICCSVLNGKPFEPDSLANWAKICVRGGNVIDVGGYTGLYSILASLLGAKPYCIEPLPMNRHRIEHNKKLNGVSFGVFAGAASDKVGKGTIKFSDSVVGLTSGASLLRKSGEAIIIDLITIDALEIDNVKAIKIDVERAEPDVLKGALKTIEKDKPAIIVEVLEVIIGKQIKRLLPHYDVVCKMDTRNWLMMPK